MFAYGWSVLELRFGLLILSFYPKGSFVLKVKDDPQVEESETWPGHKIVIYRHHATDAPRDVWERYIAQDKKHIGRAQPSYCRWHSLHCKLQFRC